MRHLAVLLLLLAACGDDSERDCNVAADPAPWLAGKYRPPAVPTKDDPLPPAGGDVSVSNLRFDPSVARSLLTVWWNGDADLPFAWEFAQARNNGSLRDARVVMLIDGVQRSFVATGGTRRDFLPLQVPAGTSGSLEASIAADDVSAGAHTLALAAIDAATGNFWESTVLTVIKDGDARFVERPDHSAQVTTGHGDGWTFATSEQSPIYLNKPIATVAADGTMQVSASLSPPDGAACAADRVPVVFTALVDFEQRALEGFGPFARVLLGGTQSGTVVSRVLAMPPPDGQRHVLTLLYYPGDGTYGEGPVGTFVGSLGAPRDVAFGFY